MLELADREGVKLRRRYGKEVRACVRAQRWRKDHSSAKERTKSSDV